MSDLVGLYGRVLEARLSRELLRGAVAAVDSRLEEDIKREAEAEKGGICNFQDSNLAITSVSTRFGGPLSTRRFHPEHGHQRTALNV